MKSAENQIKKATGELAKDLGADAAQGVKTLGRDIVKKGILPKDILGLSDTMVEGLYAQAYRLYNTGKYKEASHLFRVLVMINALEPKYSMGMGACHHMLKEYKSALNAYVICSILDPENPIPHYHASDCYAQMSDPISSLVELQVAVTRAGEKPVFKTLKDRALMTIESLKKGVFAVKEEIFDKSET
jgi:type III secretion system low calcium response chaperone LcrH/SycD